MQQPAHEVERGLVGPVHVVEQEDDRSLAAQLLDQRVVDDGERDVLLVLGGSALEHRHAAAAGRHRHGLQQGALADPGLAHHGQHAARAVEDVVQRAPHGAQLQIAADQLHGEHRRAKPTGYSASRDGTGMGFPLKRRSRSRRP